ncbi:beta-2 adrenergic receptor-like [Oculina patagonica]
MSNSSDANSSSTRATPQTFSDGFRAGTATFTIILILGTIFGNILVIVAFSLYERIRTVTNYFVVSLACTDLCVALFSMPVWVAYLLTGPMWVLGAGLSRAWTMVDILVSTASIMNLMAISFDRVLCIKHPYRHSLWMTQKKVTFIITCVWIYSLGVAVASFLIYPEPLFNLIAMVMCFCVPLLVIITAYSIVLKVALHQIKQINAHTPAQCPRRQRSFWKEIKAAKTLAVVVGAFVICWLPFVVINMIYSLCEPQQCPVTKPEVILVTKWMHYGNSLLNPIIYTVMNRDFRKAFKALLFSRDPRLQNEIFTETRVTTEVNNGFQME